MFFYDICFHEVCVVLVTLVNPGYETRKYIIRIAANEYTFCKLFSG